MTDRQKQVIVQMAKNNMKVYLAAYDMGINPKAVYYHIDKIVDETGLDPRNFYDLIKLLELVERV